MILQPRLLPGESRSTGWTEPFTRIPAWLPLPLAWLPVLVWYFKRLDDGSDEPLGLLTLTLALALAWRDRTSLHAGKHDRLAGSLSMLGSVLTIDVLPPMVRALLAILGTSAWFGIHRKPAVAALLALSLPVIASLQFYAGYPMRVAASEGAVRLLLGVGVVASRSGVNICLGGSVIGVDPACAGILMLWHGLAAAMALAAIHRVSWRATLAGGAAALLLAIPANVVRAAWLALDESGRPPVPGISHGNVGLVCFALILLPLLIFLPRHARPQAPTTASAPPGFLPIAILWLSAVLAPFGMARSSIQSPSPPPALAFTEFTFNGLTLPLEPLPASAEEAAFANSFPGSLSSHRWGERQVILRRVNQATRRLHPSRDCLRAAGFHTTHSTTVSFGDGTRWSRFTASRGTERLIVHERIVSERDGTSWTDVPAWFWSALRFPLNGPWRAETVISR